MRRTKILFVLILSVVMIFATTQLVFARATECPTPEVCPVEIDPTASGTKLSGTLTIYYERVEDNPGGCHDSTVNAYFFMRLRKGYNLYPYSGIAENVCYNDFREIQNRINDHIRDRAIPYLFPDNPTAPFAWKSFDKNVEPDTEGIPPGMPICCGMMRFSILDVVLAVQN